MQVEPDHNLIYSSTLRQDVSFFTFSGSAFYIFGPSAMRLLLPHLSRLQFLTSKSKGWTLEFVEDVKRVFMKLGFGQLIVLNVSYASVFILLIFIDSLPLLSKWVLQSLFIIVES